MMVLNKMEIFICMFFCGTMISLFSCAAKEKYTDKIMNLLLQDGIRAGDYTHVVVIPEAGCGGCISEAEHFFQECKETNILFIFTKVYSEKALRLRLGEDLKRENVLIDKKQLYIADEEEMNIYPIIIDIRGEKELEWRFLEPGISYRDVLEHIGK